MTTPTTTDHIEETLRELLSPEAADGAACDATSLYRYAAGECTPEEAQRFLAHQETCADCPGDLAMYRRESALPSPRATFFDRVRLASLSWRLVPALAAALVIVVGLGVWRTHALNPSDDAGLSLKGGYKLHIAIERGSEHFLATADTRIQAGDVLGFFYSAPRPTYLALLASDDQGRVEQAYGGLRPLPSGSEVRLEAGAVVEDGGACEWLFAVFSPSPIDLVAVRARVRDAVRGVAPACTKPTLSLDRATVDVYALGKRKP